jgi:hypothetical protein
MTLPKTCLNGWLRASRWGACKARGRHFPWLVEVAGHPGPDRYLAVAEKVCYLQRA